MMFSRYAFTKRFMIAALATAIMLFAVPLAFADDPDKSALNDAVLAVGSYTEADYPAASWEAYQAAFAEATAVNDRAEATQDEIDAALAALQSALDALESSAANAEATGATDAAEDAAVADAAEESAAEPEATEDAPAPVVVPPPAVVLNFDNPYLDINENQWFYDSVAFAYTRGFMKGTSLDPMMFSPFIPTTRGMIITVMYRIAGSPDVSAIEPYFNDVAAEAYYADAVKWGLNNGIIQGYGDGNFGPNDDITREQLVMIIYRYEVLSGATPPQVIMEKAFVDGDSINALARDAARLLYLQGIVTAKQGDFFEPTGLIARGELVAMIKRFVEAVE